MRTKGQVRRFVILARVGLEADSDRDESAAAGRLGANRLVQDRQTCRSKRSWNLRVQRSRSRTHRSNFKYSGEDEALAVLLAAHEPIIGVGRDAGQPTKWRPGGVSSSAIGYVQQLDQLSTVIPRPAPAGVVVGPIGESR